MAPACVVFNNNSKFSTGEGRHGRAKVRRRVLSSASDASGYVPMGFLEIRVYLHL